MYIKFVRKIEISKAKITVHIIVNTEDQHIIIESDDYFTSSNNILTYNKNIYDFAKDIYNNNGKEKVININEDQQMLKYLGNYQSVLFNGNITAKLCFQKKDLDLISLALSTKYYDIR